MPRLEWWVKYSPAVSASPPIELPPHAGLREPVEGEVLALPAGHAPGVDEADATADLEEARGAAVRRPQLEVGAPANAK